MVIESHLPLTESTFLILLGLTPGARRGYAILKDVQRLSGGRIQPSTGRLYGAIKRLLELAWIAPVPDPLPNPTDRQRKAYALTGAGRGVLEAETARLENLVAKASRVPAGEIS